MLCDPDRPILEDRELVGDARREALAEWIVDGRSALDLSEISTARFAARELDEAELRERCRRAYASHYRADRE